MVPNDEERSTGKSVGVREQAVGNPFWTGTGLRSRHMSTGGFNLFSAGSAGGGGGSAGGGGRGRNGAAGSGEQISLEKLFDKPPPCSPEAEMALLGALLIDPQVIHEVISIVKTGEAFFSEAHAAVFDAIIKTYDQKQSGDLVLIVEHLRDKGQFTDVGGVDYLEKLMRETPGPASAVHFAKIVSDKARLRKLIRAGGQIVYDAYNAGVLGDEGTGRSWTAPRAWSSRSPSRKRPATPPCSRCSWSRSIRSCWPCRARA